MIRSEHSLGSCVYAKEQEAAKELRANGIRIVKKMDKGVLFGVWSYRGTVEMLRLHEAQLCKAVQGKVDEVMQLTKDRNIVETN